MRSSEEDDQMGEGEMLPGSGSEEEGSSSSFRSSEERAALIEDEFAAYRDLLPESAVPEAGIRIIGYLSGDDGIMKYTYIFDGDEKIGLPIYFGLMEMAKHREMNRALYGDEEGDDEDD